MKTLPCTPELEAVARRNVWFKSPAQALAQPYHFMAYVLTYGTYEDVSTVRKYVSDSDFVDALDNAPPGIIDPRSWAYWNLKAGRYPAPPMPVRKLDE